MTALQLAICALAAWRLASLLVDEEGPFNMFGRLRAAVGADVGEIDGFLPGLFSCVACMSVWTAAAALGLWYVHPLIPGALAVAGGAMIVHRLAT